MEPNQPTGGNASNDVSNFFKDDFKEIFMAFFLNPVNGHAKNFQKPSETAMMQAGILMGVSFVACFIGMMMMWGTSDMGSLFKMSLGCVLAMMMITAFSFGIKSISGKPDFKKEMLTGALCGIPMGLFMLVAALMTLILDDSSAMSFTGGGIIGMLLIAYPLYMMSNVFHQSLTSAGTKDTMAWWVSPAAILLALYLTARIGAELMS